MKRWINFRKYDKQAAWVSFAFIFVLSTKLLLPLEAKESAGKTFLLPPTQVGTDLQKKPDHASVGFSAECFGMLPASKEQWTKSSSGAITGIHALALFFFFRFRAVERLPLSGYCTLPIYMLHCCYRI